jgi:hypothetical protein
LKGRLCVWSKEAALRFGIGVSLHVGGVGWVGLCMRTSDDTRSIL